MLKYFFIVAVCVSLMACKSKSSDEESLTDFVDSVEDMEGAELVYGNEDSSPQGIGYVSTGFRPGVNNEVLTVWWNETSNGIRGLWYYNSNDETPVRQKVISQKYNDNTKVLTGEYQYPGNPTVYSFEVKDNIFTSNDGDMIQSFTYE